MMRQVRFLVSHLPLVVDALNKEVSDASESAKEYSKSLEWISRTISAYVDHREEMQDVRIGLSLNTEVIETICAQLSSNSSKKAIQIKTLLKAAL